MERRKIPSEAYGGGVLLRDSHHASHPAILHVSADFPDVFVKRKTDAIKQLVDLTAAEFSHFVLSLNRVPTFRSLTGEPVVETAPFDYGFAVRYGAPSRGLFHSTVLAKLGDWIAEQVEEGRVPAPALLVGHKLTIEGIAVARAARRLGIPYALCIQGNTDTKIVSWRPDLAPTFRRIMDGASRVFAFAPWAMKSIAKVVGQPRRAPILLPCATELDTPRAPIVRGEGLVTAFHLDHWHTKNFDGLVAAQRALARRARLTELAVIGGGTDSARTHCERLAAMAPGVVLEGALAHDQMAQRLNRGMAMVLPSRRETFGMVFLEALFAGCPVIYPAGRAIDGYFDGAPFALRVDPASPASIADAMAVAIEQEAFLKQSLAEWQHSAAAERFRRPAIAFAFSRGLASSITGARD